MDITSLQRILLLLHVVLLLAHSVAAGSRDKTKAKSRNRPPKIKITQRKAVAMVGAVGYMQCLIEHGKPKTSRYWERNGQPVSKFGTRFDVNKKSKALRVYQAQLADSGNYTCIAKNKKGIDTMTVHLTVLQQPVIQVIPRPPVAVMEGASQQVICRSYAWPRPSYSWMTSKNVRLKAGSENMNETERSRFSVTDRVINETFTESALTISNVSSEDYGLFVCFAGNRGGTIRGHVMMDVQFAPKPPPETTALRETVFYYRSEYAPPFTLSCVALGNELPEIKWVYNGQALDTSHCQVVRNPPEIRSFACTVNETTMGVYQCWAKNSHGESLIQEFDVQPLYTPPKPMVIVGARHANRVKVTVPLGIPYTPDPNYVVVTYHQLVNGVPGPRPRDRYETTADLNREGEVTVVLPGLKERASYRVSVASKNEAGVGPEVVITLETGKTERFLEDLVRLVNISGNGQVLDLSVLADLDEKSSDEDNNSDGSTSDKNLPKYTPTDAGSDPGAKNRTAGEDDPDLKEGIASSVVGGNSASLNVRISKFNILLFVSSIVSFLRICNLAWT